MGKIKGKGTSAATLKLTLTIKREQKEVPNLLKVKRRTGGGRKNSVQVLLLSVLSVSDLKISFIYDLNSAMSLFHQ